jgi:hypothetical protein
MTIGGTSAVTEVAKRAPLSAAAANEAIAKDFMMADEDLSNVDSNYVV